jgi:hypothetical protein
MRAAHKSIRTTERYDHNKLDNYMKEEYRKKSNSKNSPASDHNINDKKNETLINA